MRTQKDSIIDKLHKLPINMVNYKYTDQLAAMKPLLWSERLCGNEFPNKQTDFSAGCWILKSLNLA